MGISSKNESAINRNDGIVAEHNMIDIKKEIPEDTSRDEDKLAIFSDDLTHIDQNIINQNKDDPASYIKKGDVLEYRVEEAGDEEDTWFLVEVLSRGKSGGKNRNYLNLRYA